MSPYLFSPNLVTVVAVHVVFNTAAKSLSQGIFFYNLLIISSYLCFSRLKKNSLKAFLLSILFFFLFFLIYLSSKYDFLNLVCVKFLRFLRIFEFFSSFLFHVYNGYNIYEELSRLRVNHVSGLNHQNK